MRNEKKDADADDDGSLFELQTFVSIIFVSLAEPFVCHFAFELIVFVLLFFKFKFVPFQCATRRR